MSADLPIRPTQASTTDRASSLASNLSVLDGHPLRFQRQGWNRLLTRCTSKSADGTPDEASGMTPQPFMIPQSFLFTGPAGVGKRQCCRAYYQFLHCVDSGLPELRPCQTCGPCVKIRSGNHPDYIEIQAEGEQILIDDLRAMKERLYFSPFEGRVRFIVIIEAHRLGQAGAHSLLKILEEPPAHTRFILTTHDRSLLPQTIQSRCQTLAFAALDQAVIEEAVRERLTQHSYVPSSQTRELLISLLEGGLSRLNFLTSEQSLRFIDEAIIGGATTKNWRDLSDRLARVENDYLELFLDLLVVKAKSRANESLLILKRQNAGSDPRDDSSDQILNSVPFQSSQYGPIYELASEALATSQLRMRLGRYANKKLIALNAAFAQEPR